MPYCTRCGKEIMEGEKCSCQKAKINWNTAAQSNNIIGQFFGLDETSRDPKIQYERGMKILPENMTPDEGEIPIRQYNLCTLRSRIKFMRAEGRLQVTNKRILFRAKGTSMTGPTVLQHEFSIAELAGFQINRNFRFSILDLILVLILSGLCAMVGRTLATAFLGFKLRVVLEILAYLIGLAAIGFTNFLGKHYITKACLAGFATSMLAKPATILLTYGKYNDKGLLQVLAVILILPVVIAMLQTLVSVILFSFKPNLDFNICTKMGSGVIHLRCESTGFAGLAPMINAVFTGYNEVLPTEETDLAIREVGAMVSDIQKLGDLAIEKWKRD